MVIFSHTLDPVRLVWMRCASLCNSVLRIEGFVNQACLGKETIIKLQSRFKGRPFRTLCIPFLILRFWAFISHLYSKGLLQALAEASFKSLSPKVAEGFLSLNCIAGEGFCWEVDCNFRVE